MSIKRIALIIPHTDITLETDLRRELPENYVVHTQRIWLDEVGEEAEKRMLDQGLPKAIEHLRGVAEFDAAVFGCTSASAVYGKEGLIRLEDFISAEMKCRAKTAFGAVLDEITRTGRKDISLITPYTSQVNKFMKKALDEFGIQALYSCGMGFSSDTEIASIDPDSIMDFIEENLENIKSIGGPAFISCTNFRSTEIRKELESLLDRKVITSNRSIIKWTMGTDFLD